MLGDRVKIITSTQFDPLYQQINDSSIGLAGKVNLLVASADLSNVNPYNTGRSYVAGNLALVNGRLQRANKFTTGVLDLDDWEDPSPPALVTANRAMVSDDEGKPIASAVTNDELAKIRGGAAIQDDNISDDGAFLHNDAGTMKQTGLPALWRWIVGKVTGGASTILTDNLIPSRLLVSNADGKVTVSSTTATELSYLAGVTSALQPQLNNKVDKTHTKRGYDLVASSQPQAVYRDKFLTSSASATAIASDYVPWVYANIDAAESSLPYWIQQLVTFFKNLENDNQFDQLIGSIPAQFSIPQGSWGVLPSQSTDMDNQVGSTATHAPESFEFIVGRNPSGTEVYTFGFTFSQFALDVAGATYPFRMIFQTVRGTSSGFGGQGVGFIASTRPRCSARSRYFRVSDYLSSAFPLMFEPITLEINK